MFLYGVWINAYIHTYIHTHTYINTYIHTLLVQSIIIAQNMGGNPIFTDI